MPVAYFPRLGYHLNHGSQNASHSGPHGQSSFAPRFGGAGDVAVRQVRRAQAEPRGLQELWHLSRSRGDQRVGQNREARGEEEARRRAEIIFFVSKQKVF